ncbi:cell division protein [Bacillus sp. FJAT-18017]|uniref:ATP-binding protein n=1 Tax=Bacillus sp. FJAT-18017 TaxID=1705566 RepID=UPI0006AEC70D|nr:ATP-binding protein [Bacillus sp. FJAT-18017]ALC89204.1 cell division protein [Bacillus sp. FJAT-18017]
MDKIEIYRSILERDKENHQIQFLLGEEYLNSGQLSEALHAFSIALKGEDPALEKAVISSLKEFLDVESIQPDELDAELIQPTEPSIKPIEPHEPDISSPAPAEEVLAYNSAQRTKGFKVIEGRKQENVISLQNRIPKTVKFDDVGGLYDLKKTIEMKIIKPFMNPGLFAKFRKKAGGGILLYGPPGCGKTFIAKATAGECRASFYPIHISEILDPYVGVSEQNLHNAFETARANSPAVVFFDELDALGFSRSKSRSDVMRPLVDTMLNELQSVETSNEKLLVIGATNMPWDVDDAFKRPGRFDKLVFVPPPDREARKAIFQLKLSGRPVESGIVYEVLADRTPLYSGADIENIVELASEKVLAEIMEGGPERPVTMEDLLDAIKSTKPTTLEWLSTIKNYIKYGNQGGMYNEAAAYIKENL